MSTKQKIILQFCVL